jgi:hypothetical protein
MKKVILALALILSVAFTSCKQHDTAGTTGADSTAVATDTVKADSTQVDSTAVAKDSVK